MTARLAALAAIFAVAACDSGSTAGPCEPAATVDPAGDGRGASLAIVDAAGCRVEWAGGAGEPREFQFGPDRDWEAVPTFLVRLSVPREDGAQLRLAFGTAGAPAPGRYPVMDLRVADDRFSAVPARFHPDSVYSWTSNGYGQGWWFATGGEVVVERSDSTGVAGTFEGSYLHGDGSRPVTVRARFHAVLGETGGYDPYSNPHGG